MQAKETTRGLAASQESHADRHGVAAATTVSADASIPISVSSSASNSCSAPVSSSLSPPTNPARPPPPPSETAPPPSAHSHTSTFSADVAPVPDGTDTTKTHSDHICVHETGGVHGASDAGACLMVNPLFIPRGPSSECRTPSGNASEAHTLDPMLLDPPSVYQTLMGITPDNSHTLTDKPHGTTGTLLEGAQIPRIDPSVSPAVMGVHVDSQDPMSVALEDFQAPLECSLDPKAAKSTQAGESLTPVDSPLGNLQTPLDIYPDRQAPMITQSGDLLAPAGSPLCDVEFPTDACSGASQSLMAAPAGLSQDTVAHPSDAFHTSTHCTALAELATLGPETTVALDEAPVVDEHMIQLPHRHSPEPSNSERDSGRMVAGSELQSELQGLVDCAPDGQDLTELSAESEPGHSVDEPTMTTFSLTHASPVTSDSPPPAHSSPPGAELPTLTQPSALNAWTEPTITPTDLLDAPSQQSISAIKQTPSDSISPSDPTQSQRWKSANDVSTWSPSSLPDAHTAGIQRQLAHLTSWGGENIYLARDAGLVTAKKAGHRMPAEKAWGLQMSGDSILAKWGQPCAPVSCLAWPAAVPVACLWFANCFACCFTCCFAYRFACCFTYCFANRFAYCFACCCAYCFAHYSCILFYALPSVLSQALLHAMSSALSAAVISCHDVAPLF